MNRRRLFVKPLKPVICFWNYYSKTLYRIRSCFIQITIECYREWVWNSKATHEWRWRQCFRPEREYGIDVGRRKRFETELFLFETDQKNLFFGKCTLGWFRANLNRIELFMVAIMGNDWKFPTWHFEIERNQDRDFPGVTGSKSLVKLLIEKGADIDAINRNNNTALIMAIFLGI